MRSSFAFLAGALLVAGTTGCPEETSDGGAGPGGSGGASSKPAWQVVLDDGAVDRALLSIWGTSATDVFAVGGPLGNTGFEALALHFDGKTWKDLHAGGADSFWWVHGTGPNDVWMVGENGRITHWDGATFVEHASGTTATLWGTFAFAPNDVWAVGGTPEGPGEGEDDVVLHFDGASWTRQILPVGVVGRALFKIWGTSSDDLYVVGESGVIWHKTNAGFVVESDGELTASTIFTVTGCGADVYAVGGRDVLHRSGGTWARLDTSFGNNVNGVACAGAGELLVVGFGGQKKRLHAGAWIDDFLAPPPGDLHAAWADPTGAFWAVGGNFVTPPKAGAPRNGLVARYGAGTVATSVE